MSEWRNWWVNLLWINQGAGWCYNNYFHDIPFPWALLLFNAMVQNWSWEMPLVLGMGARPSVSILSFSFTSSPWGRMMMIRRKSTHDESRGIISSNLYFAAALKVTLSLFEALTRRFSSCVALKLSHGSPNRTPLPASFLFSIPRMDTHCHPSF